jgi:hypothetical protein
MSHDGGRQLELLAVAQKSLPQRTLMISKTEYATVFVAPMSIVQIVQVAAAIIEAVSAFTGKAEGAEGFAGELAKLRKTLANLEEVLNDIRDLLAALLVKLEELPVKDAEIHLQSLINQVAVQAHDLRSHPDDARAVWSEFFHRREVVRQYSYASYNLLALAMRAEAELLVLSKSSKTARELALDMYIAYFESCQSASSPGSPAMRLALALDQIIKLEGEVPDQNGAVYDVSTETIHKDHCTWTQTRHVRIFGSLKDGFRAEYFYSKFDEHCSDPNGGTGHCRQCLVITVPGPERFPFRGDEPIHIFAGDPTDGLNLASSNYRQLIAEREHLNEVLGGLAKYGEAARQIKHRLGS